MVRIPVESSAVISIGYDLDSRTMEIEYRPRGEVYDYFDVPPSELEEIGKADSIGTYVNTVFKRKYPRFKKVSP